MTPAPAPVMGWLQFEPGGAAIGGGREKRQSLVPRLHDDTRGGWLAVNRRLEIIKSMGMSMLYTQIEVALSNGALGFG